ncbi:MAG TPA: LPS biosynthesis protein [candidate division Zixibacteria bacterium]|jgi:glycosyltransferase involved in cell wall biosynthesis|nr:LPS biosynthesis protein [candidate division Zixibacteria bacterium]
MKQITAVILARDEEANIGRAVDSATGLHRVLVLDSGSRDGTAEAARSRGAEVMRTDWPGFAAQRRRALSLAKTDWVLFLDADEALDEELRLKMAYFLPAAGIDGYYLRRRNHFLGRPMRHARWGDDWQLRLFRREAAAVPDVLVHEGVTVTGKTERILTGCLEHYTAPTLSRYLEKLHGYSSLEAAQKLSKGKSAGPAKMAFDLASELWKVYVRHQGWREGWRGFALAQLTALYKFTTDAKLWEMRHGGRG